MTRENSAQQLLKSMWVSSINKVESLFEDHSTMLYLNFAKDVEEITDILRRMDIMEDIRDR